jgi:PA14 domain
MTKNILSIDPSGTKISSGVQAVLVYTPVSAVPIAAKLRIEFDPDILELERLIAPTGRIYCRKKDFKTGLVPVTLTNLLGNKRGFKVLEMNFRVVGQPGDIAALLVSATNLKFTRGADVGGLVTVTRYTVKSDPLDILSGAPIVQLPATNTAEFYCCTLPVTGGVKPLFWSSEGLPDGLNLSSEGILCGWLNVTGTIRFEGVVTDGGQPSESASTCFEIQVAPGPLSFPQQEFDDFIVGMNYAIQIKAQGGTPPWLWHPINGGTGQLPKGINLDYTGSLIGCCEESGDYSPRFQVTDAAGVSAEAVLKLRARTLFSKCTCAQVQDAEAILAMPNLAPQPYDLVFDLNLPSLVTEVQTELFLDDELYWVGPLPVAQANISCQLPGGPHWLKVRFISNIVDLQQLSIHTGEKHLRPSDPFVISFSVGPSDQFEGAVMMPGSGDDLVIARSGGVSVVGLAADGIASEEWRWSYKAPDIDRILWATPGGAHLHTAVGSSKSHDAIIILKQTSGGGWAFTSLPVSSIYSTLSVGDIADDGSLQALIGDQDGVHAINLDNGQLAGPWSTLGTATNEEISAIGVCNLSEGGKDIVALNRFSGTLARVDRTVPGGPGAVLAGLLAEFFVFSGGLSTLPSLSNLSPDIIRIDSQINYPATNNLWPGLDQRFAGNFASRHTGYLNLSIPGEYLFYLASDDGSRLYIDSQLVIDNDGLHSMTEKNAQVTLLAGIHTLEVDYFQNAGDAGLVFSYSGPGISKCIVPIEVLFHAAKGETLISVHGQPVGMAIREEPGYLYAAVPCSSDNVVRTYKSDLNALKPGPIIVTGGTPVDILLADLSGFGHAAVVSADSDSNTITLALPTLAGYGIPERYAGPSGVKSIIAARDHMGAIRVMAFGATNGELVSWKNGGYGPACQVRPMWLDTDQILNGAAWVAPGALLIGNSGMGPLTIEAVEVIGPTPLLVQVIGLPAVIPPHDVLTLDVVAISTEPGSCFNSIVLSTNDPLFPQIIIGLNLKVASDQSPAGADKDFIDFGDWQIGDTVHRKWGLCAIATAVTVNSIQIISQTPGSFSFTSSLPVVIPVGSFADIKIMVNTSNPGNLRGAIIADCESNGQSFSMAAGLFCHIIAPPMPNLEFSLLAPLDLGVVKIGGSSEADLVGLNNGDGALVITGGVFTGPSAGDFQLIGNFPVTIAPWSYLYQGVVQVQYKPSVYGISKATLMLTSNDSRSTNIEVEGFALPDSPNVALSPKDINLSGILELTDWPGAEREVFLSNSSPMPCHISAGNIVGPFEIVSPVFPIEIIGGEQAIQIRALNPGQPGLVQGQIYFLTDDPKSQKLTLNLSANWMHR